MQFHSLDSSYSVQASSSSQAGACPVKYHPLSIILTVKNIQNKCFCPIQEGKMHLSSKGVVCSLLFPDIVGAMFYTQGDTYEEEPRNEKEENVSK